MSESKAALLDEIEAAVLDESLTVAAALRKCLLLGAKAGSEQLRDWARQELNGYEPESEVPDYRTVMAPLKHDYMTRYGTMTGQRFSTVLLPREVQGVINESVTLTHGIGAIEGMAEKAKANGGELKLSPPGAAELAVMLTNKYLATSEPRQVMEVYWGVSEVPLRSVVDRVRNLLTDLVAELRMAQSTEQAEPEPQAVQQVVQNIFTGRYRVGAVVNAQATNGGRASATGKQVASASQEDSSRWWTPQKVGAFIVGCAIVLGTLIALMAWHPWQH